MAVPTASSRRLSSARLLQSGGRKNNRKKQTSSFVSLTDVLLRPLPMRQTKFTQCEINRLRSFRRLHFQWPPLSGGASGGLRTRPVGVQASLRVVFDRLGKKEVHFGRVNVSRAAACRGLTWPVLLFNALLPVVCESVGRRFVSAVSAFFPGFIAASHQHPSKRLHPLVLLLDIVRCQPCPCYPVLWPLKEPPSQG